MKTRKITILFIGVIAISALIAAAVFINRDSSKQPVNQQSSQSNPKEEIPSESTVTVPEPDATDIEQLATNNIPTYAAAGSQSHAIYTSYSDTEVKGYLTYEAAPDNPASFTATKNQDGQWEITAYTVLGDTDL